MDLADYVRVGEEKVARLPPQTAKRFKRILRAHGVSILCGRASVVRDRRGNGYPFWRLYLESGAGPCRARERLYLGKEGGEQLRQAIGAMRLAYWGHTGGFRASMALLGRQMEEAEKEARTSVQNARGTLLSLVHRHLHGRTVRHRAGVSSEERFKAEFRMASRRELDRAIWPGVTEAEYVALRLAVDRKSRGSRSSGNRVV